MNNSEIAANCAVISLILSKPLRAIIVYDRSYDKNDGALWVRRIRIYEAIEAISLLPFISNGDAEDVLPTGGLSRRDLADEIMKVPS